MEKIQDIYNNEDVHTINYLTVMIIGKTGTGKSTLVNNMLKLKGGKKAKTGWGDRITTETTIYKNKEVPYIRLVDTVGIELSGGFDAINIGIEASHFIKNQISLNNVNDFVHCIWYCISSNRFEGPEVELVNNLINTIESSKIPLIIVMTQSDNIIKIKGMKEKIKKKNFENIIDILAEDIESPGGGVIKSYGLDKLMNLNLKLCKGAFDMDMKQVMIKNLKQEIKNKLFSNHKNNKIKIIQRMKYDIVKNEQANHNLEQYINNIYYYIVFYFLNNNKLGSDSSKLIRDCDFNKHRRNFFLFCQEYENKIISNELPYFANIFLNIQAKIEKEKGYNVEICNKRDYDDFINTTKKFLFDNFNIFASKFYIYFVLTNVIGKLTTSFEDELNFIVENIMTNKEIINSIHNCFYKKFSDFEKRVKNYPSLSGKTYNNYNSIYEEEEKPWMEQYEN